MIAKPGLFCGGEVRRLSDYRRQLETRHGAPKVGRAGALPTKQLVRWRDEKITLVHRNTIVQRMATLLNRNQYVGFRLYTIPA